MKPAIMSFMIAFLVMANPANANNPASPPAGFSIDDICRISKDLGTAPPPGANAHLSKAIEEGESWSTQIDGDTATMVLTRVTEAEIHFETIFQGKTHTGTKIIMAGGAPFGIRGWEESGRMVGAVYWIDADGLMHILKPSNGGSCTQQMLTPAQLLSPETLTKLGS